MAPSTSEAALSSSFQNLPWRSLDRSELLSHLDPLIASSTPRAIDAYKFLQRVAGAAGTSWRELPLEVYFAVLESPVGTLEAFVQVWSQNVSRHDKAGRAMVRRVLATAARPNGN